MAPIRLFRINAAVRPGCSTGQAGRPWRNWCQPIVLALLLAAPAHAQVSRLDQATLIDALGREGMSELLLHLAETEPPDDPVLTSKIKIAQHRIHYGRQDLVEADRVEAFGNALQLLRDTIANHRDHEQRPLWQTDLAELLLFEFLPAIHQHAAAFYEFGVTTDTQRAAFEQAAVEAYEQLADADYRFGQLQIELARRPDHGAKRINTGLWDRMINRYYKLRTQYLLAHTAYYVARLGDDHAYYHRLGANKMVRGQAPTPAVERRRLLQLALARIKPLGRNTGDPYGIRRSCLSLAGRVQMQLEDAQTALATLDRAIESPQPDLTDLRTRLARAEALHRAGKPSPAMAALNKAYEHQHVGDNLMMRLLVTDAKFRMLLAQANAKPQAARPNAVARAYAVYLAMFNDPALDAERAASLKLYVYRRWAQGMPGDDDLADLPNAVILALGETARTKAQNLTADANRSMKDGDLKRADELLAQAAPKLNRAEEVLTLLLTRETPGPAVRAAAMHNLALVTFLRDETDIDNVLKAAQLWIELARSMPGQPVSERAIALATSQLKLRHGDPATRAAVDGAYRRAAAVLFDKFATSDAADNERLAHADAVWIPDGKLDDAISSLRQVGRNHGDYFPARLRVLELRVRLYRRAPAEQRPALAQDIAAAVSRLEREARTMMSTATPQRAAIALSASARASLIRADLAMADGQPKQASHQLEAAIQQHANDPPFQRAVMGRQIVALAGAGEFDRAVDVAKRMMQRFPLDAATVIDSTLADLGEQADLLRHRAAEAPTTRQGARLEDQARNTAQTASQLAHILLDWAESQQLSEGRMLHYRLVRIKALRLAGRADEAMKLIGPLVAEHRDDAGVIHQAGETRTALGGRDNLVSAASHFDRIIRSYRRPPFPDIWWNAWMRRLQIAAELNENTSDIPLRIRRLRSLSPNLGGDRYRNTLQLLERQHR